MIEYKNFKDPRLNRLALEHQLLDDFCAQSDLITYRPVKQQRGFPPEVYHLTYRVRSIVATDAMQRPVYGDTHIAEITIPPDFPMSRNPKCYMKTPVWHPNIRFSGDAAGRICINDEVLGNWFTLDMLAERIGEILQYKNYHALDIIPHPEDATVARWVREFAEPQNIVNKAKRISTDSRPLLRPSEEWDKTRKKKVQIAMNSAETESPGSAAEKREPSIRDKITINKKPEMERKKVTVQKKRP